MRETLRTASEALVERKSAAAAARSAGAAVGPVVDLHGVQTAHAVEISRAKVEAWWAETGRGERRTQAAGLKLITGRGAHSVAGRARIRPALVKMLRDEGWAISVYDGHIVVVGRRW
ncbi:uncharacterized protein V1510DRAFT_360434 [Dipodascopsis tothii]|uniref:uncharacterized protein n=1 Tax=Dipodascopsis tothii TaxID=44089 RepID=UPI0034CF1747